MARGGYIVLGIGARFSQKQPTLEQILRWSAAFHDRWGLPTVFLWTPGKIDAPFYRGDDEIAGRLIARCPPYVHPYRGELTEVLALIGNARASVIPDSGLMHFAAASRGGVVGLFADSEGIGSAERWRPVGPRARVIQARRTVAELADEAVIAALDPLVAGAPAFA
jgi:ADP-heptose:LPS heptosyltransferase